MDKKDLIRIIAEMLLYQERGLSYPVGLRLRIEKALDEAIDENLLPTTADSHN